LALFILVLRFTCALGQCCHNSECLQSRKRLPRNPADKGNRELCFKKISRQCIDSYRFRIRTDLTHLDPDVHWESGRGSKQQKKMTKISFIKPFNWSLYITFNTVL
jgi:hypothetical protein